MSLLGKVVRWLLVPVAAAAIIVLTIMAGRGVVDLIDGRCPPQSMIGGACVEPWHTGAVEAVIYGATGLGVLALVIVPALVAPSLQRSVASAGALLGTGAVGAFYLLTTWAVVLPLLAVAVAAAALGLWWAWRRSNVHATV
ncbi:MAG: hypothetical protein GVY21_10005 [Gammaproteobacteria bacterium]|jgi:hypothetical protein|nr:hypothetical protein [Gammaproteobacteria bacterium]